MTESARTDFENAPRIKSKLLTGGRTSAKRSTNWTQSTRDWSSKSFWLISEPLWATKNWAKITLAKLTLAKNNGAAWELKLPCTLSTKLNKTCTFQYKTKKSLFDFMCSFNLQLFLSLSLIKENYLSHASKSFLSPMAFLYPLPRSYSHLLL